jgi:hypothetical protein
LIISLSLVVVLVVDLREEVVSKVVVVLVVYCKVQQK